jgi:hypothetical protein
MEARLKYAIRDYMKGALLLLVLLSTHGWAVDASALFLDVVQPVMEKDCAGCHGSGQVLSGLDLRTRAGLLKGGTRGPAVIPGDAAQSLLYKAVAGIGEVQMPPGGAAKRLPASTIAAIREWIDGGAPWAAGQSSKSWNYKAEDLWAFQPLKKPAIPGGSAGNPIDAFLLEKMRRRGLRPAPPADRRTLIRRATIDLTGLPPSPEEVEAFAKDSAPDAYARLVERLLASPRYGERWGRHWLDVARYSDTSGYSNDFERPNAWRYRDYVIRSFNADKPYDQFVREQIAGDELEPGNAEAVIATGFLRSGPWEHTAMSVEAVTRQMFLDDVTGNIGVAFLGLTVGCARCHDHKFDPIPTRDYYRLQAIFATTEFARPHVAFLKEENTRDLAMGKARMQAVVRRIDEHMTAFDERTREYMKKKLGVARVEDIPPKVMAEALRNKEGITPAEFEEFKLYQKHTQLYRESLDRYEPKAFAVSSGPLDGFTDGGMNLKYPPAAAYKAPETSILIGGNIQSPAGKVTPGVLSLVARYSGLEAPAIPSTISGRRSALAQWITDPRNPLTARVMVNRIWQYHFGRGIAADANNFGKMGRKPTHPELLDWLAAAFREHGWSVKEMHRLMMLSEAYQRSAAAPDPKDPENTLLATFSPRRMDAETLRDSILAVSGELSLEAGGPGVFPQINEDLIRQPRHAMGSLQPAYHPSPEKRLRNRRTVYTFQQRSLLDPLVEVFNGANPDLSCERREASTVPTQAFTLFNGQFVNDMAMALAARVERQAATSQDRVKRAFRLVYGRPAEAKELQLALAHLDMQTRYHQQAPPPPKREKQPIIHTITSELTGEKSQFVQLDDPTPYEENLQPRDVSPQTRALADLALVLLNSNEFAYVY